MNGMTSNVKTVVRFVSTMILLFGIYVMLHGEASPGGGFSGGVILASSFVLFTIAFGRNVATQRVSMAAAEVLLSIGALLFLMAALPNFVGGLTMGGLAFRAALYLENLGIGLLVSAGLFIVFMSLASYRVKTDREK